MAPPTLLLHHYDTSPFSEKIRKLPDDYGFDPVAGEITHVSTHEIAVRRTDPAVGEVVVHFPRVGFRVEPAE